MKPSPGPGVDKEQVLTLEWVLWVIEEQVGGGEKSGLKETDWGATLSGRFLD